MRFQCAAPFIGSLIRVRGEELLNQISVGTVNFRRRNRLEWPDEQLHQNQQWSVQLLRQQIMRGAAQNARAAAIAGTNGLLASKNG